MLLFRKELPLIVFISKNMIGVFDSGVGGLSVWRELVRLMPDEEYIYYADSTNCPYGPKDHEYVKSRSAEIVEMLLSKGCNLIVVACNTATAAAISYLRERYKVPFVGMEPAIKPAVLNSKSGVVGVLATSGTFKGRLYLDTLAKFAGDVKVIERVGEGLVELVESGNTEGAEAECLIRKYVEPMLAEGADHIVLGCTHYPFLENVIKKVVGSRAVIVNPAPAVAQQVKRLLPDNKGLSEGKTTFLSSGDTTILKKLAEAQV